MSVLIDKQMHCAAAAEEVFALYSLADSRFYMTLIRLTFCQKLTFVTNATKHIENNFVLVIFDVL